MRAQIISVVANDSVHHKRGFVYIFFKDEQGKSFRSCIDPTMRNFKRWEPYITGKEGTWLYNLTTKIVNGREIIDADSQFYEEAPDTPSEPRKSILEISPQAKQIGLFHIKELKKVLEATNVR